MNLEEVNSSSGVLEIVDSPRPGPRSLRRLLLLGGSTAAVAVAAERCLGFAANLLAARWGGPQVFGAYSVVLATATTVAGYAGAGIGGTATRFAGSHPRDSSTYLTLVRAISVVCLASALIAGLIMLIVAGPLANILLHNAGLARLLRLSAVMAVAAISLDCCRGFAVGQQKYFALLLLTAVSGGTLLLTLPGAAALVGSAAMVIAQAVSALLAVILFFVFARQLCLAPQRATTYREPIGPMVRSIMRFGGVQLGAVIGLNVASWWLASLVARGDTSLTQMGFYAVASQFRAMVAVVPGIFIMIAYPLLTEESGAKYGGAERVLLVNTFTAGASAFAIGSIVMVLFPWVLLLYGHRYAGAEVACALFIATGVVHMSNLPLSNRLNIVALRWTGIINIVWTLIAFALGTIAAVRWGAAGAAATWFIAHLASAFAVVWALRRAGALPQNVGLMAIIGNFAGLILMALGLWRVSSSHSFWPLAATLSFAAAVLVWLWRFAHDHGWWGPLWQSVKTYSTRFGLEAG